MHFSSIKTSSSGVINRSTVFKLAAQILYLSKRTLAFRRIIFSYKHFDISFFVFFNWICHYQNNQFSILCMINTWSVSIEFYQATKGTMHEAYVVFPPATIPVHIESITSYGKLKFVYLKFPLFNSLLSLWLKKQIKMLYSERVKGTCSCTPLISIQRTVEWNWHCCNSIRTSARNQSCKSKWYRNTICCSACRTMSSVWTT